jgi:hypothetical protein
MAHLQRSEISKIVKYIMLMSLFDYFHTLAVKEIILKLIISHFIHFEETNHLDLSLSLSASNIVLYSAFNSISTSFVLTNCSVHRIWRSHLNGFNLLNYYPFNQMSESSSIL